jgi:ATP-dependent DNA helicase RecG
MDSHNHIIKLGKILSEEERRGCDNTAVIGGLEQFVATWKENPDGVLELPAVQKTLELLAGYDAQPVPTRRERLSEALETLRQIFRKDNRKDATVSMSPPYGSDTAPPASTPPRTGNDAHPHANSALPGQPTTQPSTQPSTDSVKAALQKAQAKAQNQSPALKLDTPVQKIPDVGRNVAAALKRLGLKTAEDMLYHFPHRHDDYSSQKRIADLTIGEVETVIGQISEVRTFPTRRANSIGIDLRIEDETGVLKIVFFGSQWLKKQFPPGRKLVFSGKVTIRQGIRQMASPDWEPFSDDELIHTGRLVPVHPLTKGLHERNARKIIKQVVDCVAPQVAEYMPAAVLERANLLPLPMALAQMHFPDDQEMLNRARHRLAFDEFLLIQLGVLRRKMMWQSELGHAITLHPEVNEDFLLHLPFQLTGAQRGAIEEIFADMQRAIPMARLLQGDVGSGKTVVAAATLVQAIANGLQGALMAPTEILAEQHYRGLQTILSKVRVPRDNAPDQAQEQPVDSEAMQRLAEIKQLLGMTPEDDMEGQGIRIALLTGGLGKKERRRVLEGIHKGEVDLVVGTHALITESVQYHALGMVCIDEQHRFGVEQRERLKAKGFNPHMLVMTATPIPRTLTLTIYGELDTSVLDELPPGRQVIRTKWIRRSERHKAYKHIRKEIEQGRQAFVICPLVEESEKVDLPSAEEMYLQLQNDIFPDRPIGLIHGRMLPREKDHVMRSFRDHEFDVLVATAVVEVGIDVPNATTIMIDGAERFGLAQLHQFRGRVGRGQHQSYCILVSDMENEVTTQRLEAMENTNDGFALADIDLRLRGPGEFFGTRQSGTPDLKVARLADTRLLQRARGEAQKILEDDPSLEQPEHTLLRQKVESFWEKAEGAS